MEVKDVLSKYNQIVPFPWSPRKIKKAGLNPTKFLTSLGRDLGECKDKDDPTIQAILDIILTMSKG